MAVYDLAHRLARELKRSDEYTSYQEIREKVMKNQKTKDMLLDFQKEQFKLQSKAMSGQEISDEEQKKYSNLMEIVKLNRDIQKYMDAEYRMSVLLNDLQQILFADLEVGIDPDSADEAEDDMEKVDSSEETEVGDEEDSADEVVDGIEANLSEDKEKGDLEEK